MVKIICIGSFIVGLLASAINYTINYFNLDEKIENEKSEISENIK